ncbi:MAG: aminomethyl transferase family protein [Elusimicrobia bacterium]|nr:aminomethyl transferase family protein [Elusimicrobiota bacterium]
MTGISDFKQSWTAAREGAAAVRIPLPGLLLVRGKGRAGFLHGLLSADVKSLEEGRGRPACLLSAQGKLTAPLSVYAFDDEHLLVGPAQAVPAALEVLSAMSPLADCTIEAPVGERGAWLVFGPRRASVLEALAGRPADPGPDGARRVATAAGTAWALSEFFSGPDALLLVSPPDGAERFDGAVRGALEAAGALEGPPALLESLRLEAGAPAWGPEAGPDCFPQELGLERAVHPAKGCYLGQEVMARLKDRGHVNRRLVGLRLGQPAAPGDPVESADGTVLGRIGSVAPSPTLSGPMALAVLKDAGLVKGKRLRVRAGAAVVDAVLTELPL